MTTASLSLAVACVVTVSVSPSRALVAEITGVLSAGATSLTAEVAAEAALVPVPSLSVELASTRSRAFSSPSWTL